MVTSPTNKNIQFTQPEQASANIEDPNVSDVASSSDYRVFQLAYSEFFEVTDANVTNVDIGVRRPEDMAVEPTPETSTEETSAEETSAEETSAEVTSEVEKPSSEPTSPSEEPTTPSEEPATPDTFSISGIVFEDSNGDGYSNDNVDTRTGDTFRANGIGNIQVTLQTADGEFVQNARTTPNGYTFTNVAPGSYRVRVLLPLNLPFRFTQPADAPESIADKDVSDIAVIEQDFGYSKVFEVSGDVTDLDFGMYDPNEVSPTDEVAPEPSADPQPENPADEDAEQDFSQLIKWVLGSAGLLAGVAGLGLLSSGSTGSSASGVAPSSTQAPAPTQNDGAKTQAPKTQAQSPAAASQQRTTLANTGASVLGIIALALALTAGGVLLVNRKKAQ